MCAAAGVRRFLPGAESAAGISYVRPRLPTGAVLSSALSARAFRIAAQAAGLVRSLPRCGSAADKDVLIFSLAVSKRSLRFKFPRVCRSGRRAGQNNCKQNFFDHDFILLNNSIIYRCARATEFILACLRFLLICSKVPYRLRRTVEENFHSPACPLEFRPWIYRMEFPPVCARP